MRNLLLLIVTLFLLSCNSNIEKRVVSSYPNGAPLKIIHVKLQDNKEIIVKETRFFPNGEKSEEGGLNEAGKKHGVWTQWYVNGEKWIEETYENGLRTGDFTVWKDNGMKEYEGSYKEDQPSGKWIFYDKKGNKDKVTNYD